MQALNNLGTKSRLIIILLLIGIGATIMIAALAWQTSKDALVQAAKSELEGVRELRAEQVEGYFDNLHRMLLTLSEDETVINAMTHLNREFQMLDREIPQDEWWDSVDNFYLDEYFPVLAPKIDYEPTIEDFGPYRNATVYLQYHYMSNNEEEVGEKYLLDDPGDGSDYSRFHAGYHPFFRNLIDLIPIVGLQKLPTQMVYFNKVLLQPLIFDPMNRLQPIWDHLFSRLSIMGFIISVFWLSRSPPSLSTKS